MTRSLLDTDTFSELLRGKNEKVLRRGSAYRSTTGHYTTSVISVFEIISGVQQAGYLHRIDEFHKSLVAEEVIPLDAEGATLAASIHGDLLRNGQGIGRADPMIAAIAIQHDLTLITGNTQHFERIARLGYPLRLDDWRK